MQRHMLSPPEQMETAVPEMYTTAIKSTSGAGATFNLDGQKIGCRFQTECLLEAESSITQCKLASVTNTVSTSPPILRDR